ncbi:MAG: patatin-like phospholipase family protein [Phaeodactylibacter sp.]|uniref:patatin-like phospholipase family protein n=1 Tax=Phaeodactylibacter sp. TaxID=1940289 RepID=UPI0032EB6773
MAEQQNVFKIGIAMAGAVSAGAYTAGVMDYLLETLSKWEGAKERNKQLGKDHPEYDHSVPMHDVIIDVMGGSSAGGMTAAITTLGLFEGLRPINEDNPHKEQNKLYEAWVNLNDQGDGKMSTLLQMLQTEDIQENGGVISLLNSQPIDQIANRAAELNRISKLPDYISPDLEVILTITSLRGIPLAVNFFDEVKKERAFTEPPKPAHRMYLHKGIAHFKVDTSGVTGTAYAQPSHTLSFNPENEVDRMTLLQCAKATGAFPLGLAPRHLTNTQTPYIKAMVDRMFSPQRHEEGTLPNQGLRIEIEEDTFDFYAVDGGTVNNEPFGEVIRALEEKCQNDPGQNYAVLMIDPFPNFESEAQQDRDETPKLIELVPKVLGAIRGQAMMKESDLVGGLSSDHTLRMIFPSRREADQKDPYPISCGSLDGFGGFFSRGFREHDFELGRRNCQSFLRNYFCIPTEKANKDSVFRDWDASDERHKRFYSESVDGYPIVPDMNFDRRREDNQEIPLPPRQRLKPAELLSIEGNIRHRLREVLLNVDKYEKPEPVPEQEALKEQVRQILESHNHQSVKPSLMGNFITWLLKGVWKRWGAGIAANRATNMVLNTILADFQKRNLLDRDGQ